MTLTVPHLAVAVANVRLSLEADAQAPKLLICNARSASDPKRPFA
jgi:hypothetical protein